jgi:transcriptional/translational regulatory protein YebC/TACO1
VRSAHAVVENSSHCRKPESNIFTDSSQFLKARATSNQEHRHDDKRPNCISDAQVELTSTEDEESKLKLILEIRAAEDVTVVHCRARIAYRDEALESSDKIAGFCLIHDSSSSI